MPKVLKFTDEFKDTVLALAKQPGSSVPKLSKELGITAYAVRRILKGYPLVGSRRKFSEEDYRKAFALVESGSTIVEASRQTGLSTSMICQFVRGKGGMALLSLRNPIRTVKLTRVSTGPTRLVSISAATLNACGVNANDELIAEVRPGSSKGVIEIHVRVLPSPSITDGKPVQRQAGEPALEAGRPDGAAVASELGSEGGKPAV